MRPAAPGPGLTPLYGRILQPLLRRHRGDGSMRYVAEYRRLYNTATWQDLQDRQLADLRRLLRHAAATCPFYRERFANAGFTPEQVRAPEDMRRIPSLARADIVARYEELLSTAFDRDELVTRKTGGTVNVPIPFAQNREGVDRTNALAEVLYSEMGWHPGMKQAWLWGAAQDKPAKERPAFQAWKEDLVIRYVQRSMDLDAGDLPPDVCDRHLRELAAFGPHVLQGYPVATDLVAQRALATGVRLNIPTVILTAEPIIPAHRERIAEAFGANVLSFYGSRENGWIAFDHPETKEMLINTAGVFVESDPETNELYITDLLNYGMPLIRYEIGDRGSLSPDPAVSGDARPVLAAIHGRTADVVVLPSGRIIPGVNADYRGLVLDPEGLVDVQLVQNDLHTMDVFYVPGPQFKQASLDVYVERMSRLFMDELELTAHAVERIPAGPNGKVRALISHVPHPGSPGA